jgi:hypothetical protein
MGWSEACIGLLFAANLIAVSSALLNHDVAWSVTAAEMVLDGSHLYRDILEVNPPLFIVLAVPAVWVARHLGTSAPYAFVVFVHALVLLSLALSAAVLRRLPGNGPLLTMALTGARAVLLLPLAVPIFGQREHLFMMLWVPYVFTLVLRSMNGALPGWLAALIGVFGGFGIALKPTFLLPWAAVEAHLAWRLGRWRLRPEVLGASAVVAGYAGVLLVVWPEYPFEIFPLVLKTYWTYANPLAQVLLRPSVLVVLLAIAITSVVEVEDQTHQRLRGALRVATVSTLLVALIHRTGWNYQVYPALAFACQLTVVVAVARLGDMRAGWSERSRRVLVMGALVAASVAAMAGGLSRLAHMQRGPLGLLPVLRECERGASVGMLSTDINLAFPAVTYSDLRWVFRYPAVWPLPAALRARQDALASGHPSPAEADALEAGVLDTVLTDLERTLPDVLVVDGRRFKPAMGGVKLDYLEYLGRRERFRKVFGDYRPVRQVGPHTVYWRNGSPHCPAPAAAPAAAAALAPQ